VSIVPDERNFIRRYEYNIGDREPIPLMPEDVIHWKTPNPLNDFYGMPPLKGIATVVDLDNYGFEFISNYYTNAGVPGGILTTKAKLSDLQRQEIKDRFNREYGSGKWHGLLVLDSAEATFQAMTQNLGAQGLVLPELNKILEARITGALGVPPTLVGTVIGTEASSYGNKKSERESFWNETMKPLYRELVGPLNRSLVPDFPGVKRVDFDLSTVGALLPDADAVQKRLRDDLMAGGLSIEEFRAKSGYGSLPSGNTFLIPANLTQTKTEDIGKQPEPVAAPAFGGAE
jgi:HK97 family phage portal protein